MARRYKWAMRVASQEAIAHSLLGTAALVAIMVFYHLVLERVIALRIFCDTRFGLTYFSR